MSLPKSYNKKLIQRGLNGNLEIHHPFKLGQIVTWNRRSGFEVIGHINDDFIGLDFQANEINGRGIADLDFGNETGVELRAKFAGNAQLPNSNLGIDDAGFSIEFESKGSYLLKTSGTKISYIENIAELGKKVRHFYLNKKWNRNWFVITLLVSAEVATLLISKSASGKIELKATGEFTGVEEELISVNAKFATAWKKDISTNIIGKEGPFFPLFKCNGIKIRRRRPVGSPFESIDTLNPMNTFTIDRLETTDDFDLTFEDYLFEEELSE